MGRHYAIGWCAICRQGHGWKKTTFQAVDGLCPQNHTMERWLAAETVYLLIGDHNGWPEAYQGLVDARLKEEP